MLHDVINYWEVFPIGLPRNGNDKPKCSRKARVGGNGNEFTPSAAEARGD
jgi:hypothetical protein